MPFTPAPTNGNDILTDTPGDDGFIDALAGNDQITVSGGFDSVDGGADRDRLIIDYAGATQGVSTSSFSGSLAAGYSGRIWQGNGAFQVDFFGIEDFTVTTGGSNDNILVGDGNDVVNLGGGDDFANFGAGNDSGDGGTGTDGFSVNLGAATAAIGINLVTGVSATFSNFEYLGTLLTGSGADTIVTRAITRDEIINTGAGADTITVAGGFDNVDGGADRDRLIIDYSGATQGVITSSGRIWQGNSAFQVDFSGIEDFTVTTGGSNDNIIVSNGDDVVNLGGGDDFADFGAGNDSGDGGTGTDGFSANLGSATAAIGINLVTGVSAAFSNFEYLGTLTTGSGNDTIVTRAITRDEVINTGAGADTITVAGGFDNITGGADRDRLIIDYRGATQAVSTSSISGSLAAGYSGRIWQGNSAFQADFGGIEDFTVFSGTGNFADNITTGDGDDVFYHYAFAPNELFYFLDAVNLGGGTDLVVGDFSTIVNNAVSNVVEMDGTYVLTVGGNGKVAADNIERVHVIGGAQGDTLTGLAGNDIFEGRAGNDTLNGGVGGNDILNGGLGADTMTGGVGDDTYHVNEAGDQIVEASNEGADTVLSSALTYTLGANVENLASTLPERPYVVAAETQINTDIVAATQHPRSVTVLNDGGYVVTWQDVNNGNDARARVFNADGTARSAEFTVNPSTAGNQGQFGLASVALANGGFLVAYYDTTTGPTGERIAGRAYDANGVALGTDYTLTDTAGTFDSFPAMARLNDGRIALLSQNGGSQDGNGTFGIRYTLLNADGSVGAGASTVFQTTISGDQLGPAMARLDDGRLIVVWESGEPGGKVFRGRFIDANGTPSGNDFAVSSPGGEAPDSGEVRAQVTALNGGGFAVVWGITNEIVGRVFNSAGLPLGPEFTVNQRPAGAQTTVAITRLAEGGFIAAWTSDQGEDGDAQSVVARLFNADGSARGDDFVVNQIGTRFQLFPEMATLQDGRVVVVFSSDVPGSGSNYEGKQIILDTTPDQTLTGNELANQITGGAANDTLNGAGGNDTLDGGAGVDSMTGGAGDDTFIVDNVFDVVVEAAGGGDDRVLASSNFELAPNLEVEELSVRDAASTTRIELGGNNLANRLTGNAGVNILFDRGGADIMTGLGGSDQYLVNDASDQVIEAVEAGSDDIVFTTVSFTLAAGQQIEELAAAVTAGTGALTLTGNELGNRIYGNNGANVLDGGGSADLMVGFGGDDMYMVDNTGDIILEFAGGGNDTVRTTMSFGLTGGQEVEEISAFDPASTARLDLTGNMLANRLIGNAGVNVLIGGGGADILTGLGGNDQYLVDSLDDSVIEAAGGGDDIVFTLATYYLAAGQEIEELAAADAGGTAALTLYGNEFANRIYGNAGANVIVGLGGADTMAGLGGNDQYLVDQVGDQVIEFAGGGNDTVFVQASYALGAGQEIEELVAAVQTATTRLDLAGNEFANRLFGNEGVNIMSGGAGADQMTGYGGDDQYLVDVAGDQVIEAAGGGFDTVFALNSYTLAAGVAVEELAAASATGAINLFGNELANALYGNSGVNLLYGGGANDTLFGGSGADFFGFNTALATAGVDRILDFEAGVDKFALDDSAFVGLSSVNASNFVIGQSGAQDADDRIIYDNVAGALFFDADGNGAGAAVLFATLAPALPLTANDFVVI